MTKATPLKVLHLIPTLSSGGAERQLVNLVTATSKELIEHVVCVIGESEFFGPTIREAGYRVQSLNISGKRPFVAAASGFRRVIREEKPDIIHSWLYDANIAARLGRLLNSKAPIVTSLQLADYEPEAARIGNWNPHKVRVLKFIDKFTSAIAKPYFAACSEFVKDSYIRNYGIDAARTEVIYNSVNAGLLATSADDVEKIGREFDFPPDTFVFLNVGRLDAQKNHRTIFEAFRAVSEEIPESVLLLAGVGGLEEELKRNVAELGLDNKVRFLGRRNDVGALLEFADVFVFPSFFEGLPVALVEAMTKRLPCIASRIDVFEEVIVDGDNGILVDPNSPNELKDAMIRLYRDAGVRKSLGTRAFETADSQFNIARTARKWEAFYQRIAERK